MKLSGLINYLQSLQQTEGDIEVVSWGYTGWRKVDEPSAFMRVVDCRSQVRGEPEESYRGLMIYHEPDPPRG